MTRQMAPNRPRERRGWLRGLWLIWSLITGFSLLLSSLILATQYTIADDRVFSGEIVTTATNTAVLLPPNLPVQAVLVQPGQTVQAGQTLVALDRTLIALKLEEEQRRILVQSALRQCFLRDSYHVTMLTGAQDLDGETNLQLQSAAEECRLAHSENALAQTRIEEALEHLKKQLKLHDMRVLLALSKLNSVQQRQKTSLIFALEREKIKRKIGHLNQEHAALELANAQRLLDRAIAIQDRVYEARQHQKVLQQFVETPRLQAPHAGVVVNTRPTILERSSALAQEIITLRTQDALTYRAHFTLPETTAATLAVGDVVEISHSGDRLAASVYEGRIRGVNPVVQDETSKGSEHIIMLEIELPPALTDAIDLNGLRTSRDRVLITVSLPELSVLTALNRQFMVYVNDLSAHISGFKSIF